MYLYCLVCEMEDFIENCIPHSINLIKSYGHLFKNVSYLKNLQTLRDSIRENIVASDHKVDSERFKAIARDCQEYYRKWIALVNAIRSKSHIMASKGVSVFSWTMPFESETRYSIVSTCLSIETFFVTMNYATSLFNMGLVYFRDKKEFDVPFQMALSLYHTADGQLEHMYIVNTAQRELLVMWDQWMYDLTLILYMFLKVLRSTNVKHQMVLATKMYQRAKEFSKVCKILRSRENGTLCLVVQHFACFEQLEAWFYQLYESVKMVAFYLFYKSKNFTPEYTEAFEMAQVAYERLQVADNPFCYPEIQRLEEKIKDNPFKFNATPFRYQSKDNIKDLMMEECTLTEDIFPENLERIELNLDSNYRELNAGLLTRYALL